LLDGLSDILFVEAAGQDDARFQVAGYAPIEGLAGSGTVQENGFCRVGEIW
jgi:hypothetical protein